MNYVEKIKAISKRINVFGGTTVSFKDSKHIIGFNKYAIGENYYMFRGFTMDDKVIGRSDRGEEIRIPLHWLSEMYLYGIYDEYMKACKEQLSESAYKEIEKVVAD